MVLGGFEWLRLVSGGTRGPGGARGVHGSAVLNGPHNARPPQLKISVGRPDPHYLNSRPGRRAIAEVAMLGWNITIAR